MAKSKVVKKTPVRSVRAQYNCDDVEKYFDKAVYRVKKDIIPRINAIDERDKAQFALAKDHIGNYTTILQNQDTIKENQGTMKQEIITLAERQKRVYEDFVPRLTAGIESIHTKLDSHIIDETTEFKEIRNSSDKLSQTIGSIQHTLDNVSANGNRGLSASFTDVYNKLTDLETITQGARARAKFYTVLHDVVVTTPFLKPLKYKWGAILYVMIFMLILNTFLREFGVAFDLIAIFKWLFTFGKGG